MSDCGRASDATYKARGCRCDACRAAHARAERMRTRRAAYGRTLFVDAGPVRERVRALLAAGYSGRELARMGVPRTTMRSLLVASPRTGRPTGRVTRELAERVAGIHGRLLGRAQLVDAGACELMCRTWRDAGVSAAEIARESGLSRSTVDRLLKGGCAKVCATTLARMLAARDGLDALAADEADRRSPARGGGSLCRTLSDWEVEEAHALWRGGMSPNRLAERYGVGYRTLLGAFKRLEEMESRDG